MRIIVNDNSCEIFFDFKDLQSKGTSIRHLNPTQLESLKAIYVETDEYLYWVLQWIEEPYMFSAPRWCREIQEYVKDSKGNIIIEIESKQQAHA